MKTLVITVAGTATRFNRDTEEPALKCLYNIGGPQNSLLYQILDKAREFDEYIIVGGYLFDRLSEFVDSHLNEFKDRIKLVYNDKYSAYGSGYSLISGIMNADPQTDEILFVEGDLYFDKEAFERIKNSERNVFTVNHEIITARKAVVVYENVNNQLRYLYDTSHNNLCIDEPFLAIYNSGQVWKFNDVTRLKTVVEGLNDSQIKGTNLEIIQSYFGNLSPTEYDMVQFSVWHNCNTVADYRIVYSKIEADIK